MGPTGATGATGASLTTNAVSAAMTNAQNITVTSGGTGIPLNTTTYSSSAFTQTSLTTFTVNTTGCYLATYTANVTTPSQNSTAIYVNGTAATGTVFTPPGAASGTDTTFFNNTSILCLAAGQTIQLTMFGPTANTTFTPGTGASLTLTQIS